MSALVSSLYILALGMILLPVLPRFVANIRRQPLVLPVTLSVIGGGLATALEKLSMLSSIQATGISVAVYAVALVAAVRIPGRRTTIGLPVIGISLIFLGQIFGVLVNDRAYEEGAVLLVQVAMEALPFVVAIKVLRSETGGSRALLALVYWTAFPLVSLSLLAGALDLPFAFAGVGPSGESAFGEGAGRLSGIATHPNSLGTLATVMVIARLAMRDGVLKLALLLLLPFTVVLLTGMRTAILSILAALVIYALSHARSRLARAGQLLASAGGTLLIPVALGLAEGLANARSASVESREYLWSFLLERFDLYLPFGLGPSGVYDAALRNSLPERFFHAHNQFLTYVVGGGVISLIGVSMVLVAVVATLKTRPSARIIAIGLLPLLLLESPLHTGMATHLQPVSVLVWILIAIALRRNDELREEVFQEVEHERSRQSV